LGSCLFGARKEGKTCLKWVREEMRGVLRRGNTLELKVGRRGGSGY